MVTWTMNDNEKLKSTIKKNLDVRASDETHDHMRSIVLDAHGRARETASANPLTLTRSILMKNPITKLAIATAVAVAVLIGIGVFTSSGSGVVWAEVAQRVQASRGVIFRLTEEIEPDPYSQRVDFSINHYSSTQARLDRYIGDEVANTMYNNCDTKTVILVDHVHKSYVQDTNAKGMPDSLGIADPNNMIERFLATEHRELGQRTIDGVLCEGIETTDTALYGTKNPPDSLTAQIWVSVETGYPVRCESEHVRDNGQKRLKWVTDQFQWDVDLDEQLFEPDVPADYIDISPDEW